MYTSFKDTLIRYYATLAWALQREGGGPRNATEERTENPLKKNDPNWGKGESST